MTEEARTGSKSTHLYILLVGLLLSACFIFFLLIIVNSALNFSENHISAAPAGFAPNVSPHETFTTRRSYFVYETLLAGMLGAYLGEIFQIGTLKTDAELRAYGQRFMAALFLGGAAAIVVGVLFPLVVLGMFEGEKINSWTLVAAAGIAGNRARDAFSQVENVIARLLANFEPHLDNAAISESVKVGLQEAFAGPLPVKYHGLIATDVTGYNESVILSDGDTRIARLEYDREYELRVQFAVDESLLYTVRRGVLKTISIRDGDDQAMVPFRLLVDFGFISLPPEERMIMAPSKGASGVETFFFKVPSQSPRVDEEAGAHSGGPTPSEARLRPEISITIYQQLRYFDTVVLPFVVPT
jgi:hypothetical protein